jgi:hypothetical protein
VFQAHIAGRAPAVSGMKMEVTNKTHNKSLSRFELLVKISPKIRFLKVVAQALLPFRPFLF